MDLKVLVAVLLVLVLTNGVTLAWRHAAARDQVPTTYYEFQISRWEQQLHDDPDDPVVWATLGELFGATGQDRKAERAFSRAFERDPGSVPALMYYARAAAEQEDYARARELLTEVLEGLPEGGRYLVYYEIGEVERARGDVDAAVEAFEASIADNGSYFNAYEQLAFLYAAVGETGKAVAAAERTQQFTGGDRTELAELLESLAAQPAMQTEDVE